MKIIVMILGIVLLNNFDSLLVNNRNFYTAKDSIDRSNYQLLSEAVPPDRGSPRRRGRGRFKDSSDFDDKIIFFT